MFLLDEDAVLPLPKIYLSEATLGTRQAALRERVKGTVPLRLASSPDRLEMLLFQALTELKQPPVIRDSTDHLFPLVMPEESPPGEASSDHSWHEFVPVVFA
jgi:hypothetical protein